MNTCGAFTGRNSIKHCYFINVNLILIISNEMTSTQSEVFKMIVSVLYVLMLFCVRLLGVIMVYFSGYLIEATGSWASVFGIITVVNLLGLGTFLSFGEARRMDIDLAKGRYHNIHIWAQRTRAGSDRNLSEEGCPQQSLVSSVRFSRDRLLSVWLFFGWRESRRSCRRSVIDH